MVDAGPDMERIVLEQVRREGTDYTLSSRPLSIGCEVEVLIDGRWTAGVVSAYESIKVIEVPQGYGTKALIILSEGLVARWPR